MRSPLLDLAVERLAGFLGFGDVAGDLGCADDRAGRRPDRGDAERNRDRGSVAAQSHRFVMLDRARPGRSGSACRASRTAFGRNDEIDIPGRRLRPRVNPNSRSAAGFQPVIVPSSDFVTMASWEDSTAALNRCRARHGGRARLRCGDVPRPRARARRFWRWPRRSPARRRAPARRSRRSHRPEWRRGPLRPAPSTAAVNCTIGRVSERATSTASTAAHNTAISPTSTEVFWIESAVIMTTAFGAVLITATHSLPARMAGASAMPPGTSGLIRQDMRDTLRGADRGCEGREIASASWSACRARSRIRARGRDERDSRRVH